MIPGLLLALQAVAAAPPRGPGDSLTLAQALERARRSRPQVAAAAAGVTEARAALRAAGAIPNPTVSYSRTEDTPRNHLLVDQSLDWLLRRGADRGAARAGIARARADSAGAIAGLLRDVRAGFYRARAARMAEALVGAQAALADSVARIAAARLRAGDISLLEQEQAAQEAARARQAASSAREAARVAAAGLARLVAWPGPPPAPAGPLDAGLDALPDTTLDVEGIPALRSAVADSAAAAAQVRSASRARIPFPSLQAGADWGDPTETGALSVVGIAVPLPLWSRGGGPVAAARARAAQTAALAREARLEAVRAVREARIHLEETALRARLARDSLLPAAAVLRARAVRAYQAGETGILPVIDALRGERDVSLAALQDQLAFQEALAEWYALTGRSE
ncbi:MAG TPA: TolC family protein [Gemmatimonadales bacterium]|nr:TolC family protein [Gemmatimonadales bacterium]